MTDRLDDPGHAVTGRLDDPGRAMTGFHGLEIMR